MAAPTSSISSAAPPAAAGPSLPPLADKEGYLEKEGANVKSWRLRWFVLVGTALSYYRQRGDDKPAGTIDVAGAEIVEVDDFVRRRRHEHLFHVRVPHRTYNIIAPDYDTRRAWVDILRARAAGAAVVAAAPAATPAVRIVSVVGPPAPIAVPAGGRQRAGEDDELLLAKAREPRAPAPPDLKPIHRLIGERCIGCKAQIEDLLYCPPDKLLAILRESLQRVNLLMNDCYYFTSLELDRFREQTVMRHCSAIEAGFRQMLYRARAMAVKQKADAPADELNALQEELHTCVYGLLSQLDQLRTDNAAMEAALTVAEVSIPTRTLDFRHTMARAGRNLEEAMDELERLSSSSSSSAGTSPMLVMGVSASGSAGQGARTTPSPSSSSRSSPRMSLRASPQGVVGARTAVYVEPPAVATLVPPGGGDKRRSVLPPRSQSDKAVAAAARAPTATAAAVPASAPPARGLPPRASSVPSSTTADVDLASFDVLSDIVDAIVFELDSEQ